MSKQQLIELTTTIGGKERKYIGRFLGFIKDSEFNALVQNPTKVPTRLESKATQPLMEVAPKFDQMIGHRLVMSIKKVDDKTVLKKTLFITEGLETIDEVTPPQKEDKAKNKKATAGKVTFASATDERIEVQEIE